MTTDDDLLSDVEVIAEHLRAASRAAVVNPAIVRLRAAIGQRFRRQFRDLSADLEKLATANRAGIRGAVAGIQALSYQPFRIAYERATAGAYKGASKLVGTELRKTEAADDKKKKRIRAWVGGPVLPGHQRTAADVEADIDVTSVGRLETALNAARDAGQNKEGLIATARGLLQDWARNVEGSRADTIAGHEIAGAFNAGTIDAGRALAGDTGQALLKEWWAEPDACDICVANTNDQIALDEPFESGDQAPPAHINCRCSLLIVEDTSS